MHKKLTKNRPYYTTRRKAAVYTKYSYLEGQWDFKGVIVEKHSQFEVLYHVFRSRDDMKNAKNYNETPVSRRRHKGYFLSECPFWLYLRLCSEKNVYTTSGYKRHIHNKPSNIRNRIHILYIIYNRYVCITGQWIVDPPPRDNNGRRRR